MMHGGGTSGEAIVAMKPANKAERSATKPGSRVTGTGAHTASCKGKGEGEVHLAPPSHQRRPARGGVRRIEAERCAGRGRADVSGLRSRPRAQSRGSACAGPSGSVSGTAVTAGLHTQA